jgi:hypothetical protein
MILFNKNPFACVCNEHLVAVDVLSFIKLQQLLSSICKIDQLLLILLILPQPKTAAYESVDIADRLDDLLAVKHEKRESHARWKRWKRSMRREREPCKVAGKTKSKGE